MTQIPAAIEGIEVPGRNLYEQADNVLNRAMNRRTRAQWVPAATAIAAALDSAAGPTRWNGTVAPTGRSMRDAFGL